jgi:hypothetical protein
MDLGYARNLTADRLGKLAGSYARNRASERDFAINGSGGEGIIGERLSGIEMMHNVHLDLTVRARSG